MLFNKPVIVFATTSLTKGGVGADIRDIRVIANTASALIVCIHIEVL